MPPEALKFLEGDESMTETLAVRKELVALPSLLELQPLEELAVLDDEKAWGILVGFIMAVCGGL